MILRLYCVIQALILGLLIIRLSSDTDGIRKLLELQKNLAAQQSYIATLAERNQSLLAEVQLLKKNPAAIEELARFELGMIRHNEEYYQVIEPIE